MKENMNENENNKKKPNQILITFVNQCNNEKYL